MVKNVEFWERLFRYLFRPESYRNMEIIRKTTKNVSLNSKNCGVRGSRVQRSEKKPGLHPCIYQRSANRYNDVYPLIHSTIMTDICSRSSLQDTHADSPARTRQPHHPHHPQTALHFLSEL